MKKLSFSLLTLLSLLFITSCIPTHFNEADDYMPISIYNIEKKEHKSLAPSKYYYDRIIGVDHDQKEFYVVVSMYWEKKTYVYKYTYDGVLLNKYKLPNYVKSENVIIDVLKHKIYYNCYIKAKTVKKHERSVVQELPYSIICEYDLSTENSVTLYKNEGLCDNITIIDNMLSWTFSDRENNIDEGIMRYDFSQNSVLNNVVLPKNSKKYRLLSPNLSLVFGSFISDRMSLFDIKKQEIVKNYNFFGNFKKEFDTSQIMNVFIEQSKKFCAITYKKDIIGPQEILICDLDSGFIVCDDFPKFQVIRQVHFISPSEVIISADNKIIKYNFETKDYFIFTENYSNVPQFIYDYPYIFINDVSM